MKKKIICESKDMYCLNNVHKKLNTSNKNFSVGCYSYYNTYNEHIK